MAEDREAFRDLLDRIDQPYAPTSIVEGATDAERDVRRGGARRRSACRPSSARRSRSAARVAASSRPRRPTASASAPGLRASPIGQVMVERCLVGWQEIEYEVMRDADDTCIAVCSMENVDPLGVHTGDSIVVAPVQTLHRRRPPAAAQRGPRHHPGARRRGRLQRPVRALARLHRVRGHRGQPARLALVGARLSKATGYPIARVAAQIAVGRRLAEIPNVVTGTTVAAFEPALDYVVVKLPRFPFDKFPTADRTLGSQMKATGEVMAIDRTFGSALNKALRGLEQAGVGPLAEDPTWTPAFDYLAAVYAGDRGRRTSRSAGSTSAGEACECTRYAQRSAAPDRPAPVPRAVRLAAVAAARPAPAGRAGGRRRRGDRDLGMVPRRDGPERGAGART